MGREKRGRLIDSSDCGCINLDDSRNELLGALDELNSFIGLVKSLVEKDGRDVRLLTRIQNDLFLIQAEVASPDMILYKPELVSQDHIRFLERETEHFEKNLEELDHFIIPEGGTYACYLHCFRTVSRRTEREILAYGRRRIVEITTDQNAMISDLEEFSSRINLLARYLDRVACLAFAMARAVNKELGFKEREPAYCSFCSFVGDLPEGTTEKEKGRKNER